NTNSNNQLVLVTFTSLTDPTKTVTALIQTDQQGQEGNFVFDAEFIINPTHDYLVTLEWIAGPNVIITDLSIEGVVIVDQGNFKIGDGTGGSTHAISAIISPDDGLLLQGPTESTDGTGGGNT